MLTLLDKLFDNKKKHYKIILIKTLLDYFLLVSKIQKLCSGRAEVGGEEQKEAQELHGAAGDPAGLGGDYPEPGVCRG